MKHVSMTPALYEYLIGHATPLHDALPKLAEETRRLPDSGMQIAPEQGVLMHLLTKLHGTRQALEIGCYTGYSALCVALALPKGGHLTTLDINPETSSIARRYFFEAGVTDRITVRIGNANETLRILLKDHGPGSFDQVFIDADKENLWSYFEASLALLRSGGLILVDNVLWSGKVVDSSVDDPPTTAIRRFNERVRSDTRVTGVMLPVADGLYVLRKN